MCRRVLVISNMYPSPEQPARGAFIERCVHGLRSAGVAVDLAVLPGSQPGGAWRKLLAYAHFAWQANRRLLAGGHAVVWIHYPLHSLLAAWPALWFARAPVVLNFHGHDLLPVTRRGRWLKRLLRSRFAAAERVIVPSQHFGRIFSARYGAGRARVFPSGGVGAQHFAAVPPLAGRPRDVLFLSRWVRGKGWPCIVALAGRLAEAGVDMHFTIAGGGPDGAQIKTALAQTGLAGRVQMVACENAEQAAQLMRQHRAFVLPSHFDEALALVNLEAMAGGCVVLTRDFAAAREYIVHGKNGLVFGAERFVDDCAEALCALHRDLPAAQRIADAARAAAAPYAHSRVLAELPALLGLDAAA